MPITLPNYGRKLIGFSSEQRSASLRNRDRHQFGTLIAIPRNPQSTAPKREREGRIEHEYRAKRSDCRECPHQKECCPNVKNTGRTITRSEPSDLVKAFRERMETEPYKKLYRQRSEVAEFPNAWLKAKFGLRRFRLRGMAKANLECLWAILTYNLKQAIRLGRQLQVTGNA